MDRSHSRFRSAVRTLPLTFDFSTANPGDIVKVQTRNSEWYFVRTRNSYATRDTITGVCIQNNSHGFPQVKTDPAHTSVSRYFEVDSFIDVNRGGTSAVRAVFLNGVKVAGE